MSRITFDPETIQRLAAILKETGLTELEIHDDKSRLRLVAAPPHLVAPHLVAPHLAAPLTAAAPAPTPAHAPVAAPAPPAEAPPSAGTVKSPMVGIAYLAPEPGAPAYITLGATVTAGQTVMLIEAMKTFNQIKAPHAGTVTQILVTTGAPVEYDQPLLVIA